MLASPGNPQNSYYQFNCCCYNSPCGVPQSSVFSGLGQLFYCISNDVTRTFRAINNPNYGYGTGQGYVPPVQQPMNWMPVLVIAGLFILVFALKK